MSKPKVDTITALSTPTGRAALSIIRVSGPDTYTIISKIFKTGGKQSFPLAYTAYYGSIIEPKSMQIVDRVVLTCFIAPKSYTGEDCVEITTHGNPIIVSRILSLLINEGARGAEPGEFTRRAFFNGKMDLLDVEATAQVLTANSITQARIALNQLSGLPSSRVSKFRNEIIEHLVQLEASLNFPEDAIEAIDEHKLARDLHKIYTELENFAENAKNGSLIAAGLKISLLGKPNSGKSSIMNRLLGRDRAIVTKIPGTTRDTLEETFQIGQFPVKLVDTAGLREANDQIEKLGIERTIRAIDEAYLVVAIFDGSCEPNDEDYKIMSMLANLTCPYICLRNKSDLKNNFPDSFFDGIEFIDVSAESGKGMDTLISKIKQCIKTTGITAMENMVLLGAQQTNSLEKALAAVKRSAEGAGVIYQDMLAIELEEAVRELGRINGETVDLNTLDLIFERFCIGK